MNRIRLKAALATVALAINSLLLLGAPQVQAATANSLTGQSLQASSVLTPTEELVPKFVRGVMHPIVIGNVMYFFATQATAGVSGADQQLWKFDGQKLTQLSDFAQDAEAFSYHATSLAGKIYFDRNIRVTGTTPDQSGTLSGRELFVFDPITEQTSLVQDLNPLGSGLFGQCAGVKPAVFGQKIMMCGRDGTTGDQLFQVDPSAPEPFTKVSNFASPANPIGSFPQQLIVFQDKLFLSAAHEGAFRLWSYDGTSLSVVAAALALRDIYHPVVFGNQLVFAATRADTGTELFGFDGLTAPQLIADIVPGTDGSFVYDMSVHKEKLYFTAEYIDEAGYFDAEPWVYDGLTTTRYFDALPSGESSSDYSSASWASSYQSVGDLLFFAGETPDNSLGAWVSDGTNPPTPLVANVEAPNVTAIDSYGDFITEFKGRLYVRTQSADQTLNGLWSFAIPSFVDTQDQQPITYRPVLDLPREITAPPAIARSSGTKRISTEQVRVITKNPPLNSKVQFFLNGKEVAWVRVGSANDEKLRQDATGGQYFVRSLTLKPGKNTIEVFVNGVREKRVAYTLR